MFNESLGRKESRFVQAVPLTARVFADSESHGLEVWAQLMRGVVLLGDEFSRFFFDVFRSFLCSMLNFKVEISLENPLHGFSTAVN